MQGLFHHRSLTEPIRPQAPLPRETGKKILLFSPHCLPPIGPEAIVAAKWVTAMSDAGWSIDLITWQNSLNFYPEDVTNPWQKINGHVYSVYGSNQLKFRNAFRISKSAFKTRHFNPGLIWADESIDIAKSLVRKNHYDVMISRSNPYWGHLPALVLKKKVRMPWIAVWNDPAPQNKLPPPYGNGPLAPIPWVLSRYLKDVSLNADRHVFCSERLMNYMCSYLPAGTKPKSTVIPHICLKKFETTANANTRFILAHSGMIGGERKVDVFIDGVMKFLKKQPGAPVEIHWIGHVDSGVRNKIAQNGLEEISSYLGPLSYVESLRHQNKATILIIVEAPCEEGIFLPSKFVDYVQSGKPILAISPLRGTLNDILSKHGGGIAADVNSSDSIETALSVFYKSWKSGNLEKAFGSNKLQKQFSESRALADYQAMIDNL